TEFDGTVGLERGLERARKAGFSELVANRYVPLAFVAVEEHRHADATRWLDEGIAYCSERGFELFRLYLLAARARLELHLGHWGGGRGWGRRTSRPWRSRRPSTRTRYAGHTTSCNGSGRSGRRPSRRGGSASWGHASRAGRVRRRAATLRTWRHASSKCSGSSPKGCATPTSPGSCFCRRRPTTITCPRSCA